MIGAEHSARHGDGSSAGSSVRPGDGVRYRRRCDWARTRLGSGCSRRRPGDQPRVPGLGRRGEGAVQSKRRLRRHELLRRLERRPRAGTAGSTGVTPTGAHLDGDGIGIATGQMPAVAFDGENFLVVWKAGEGMPGPGIKAVRVTQDGLVLPPVLTLSSADTTHYSEYPTVAFNGTDYLVVWTDVQFISGDLQDYLTGAIVSRSGQILQNGIEYFERAERATGTANRIRRGSLPRCLDGPPLAVMGRLRNTRQREWKRPRWFRDPDHARRGRLPRRRRRRNQLSRRLGTGRHRRETGEPRGGGARPESHSDLDRAQSPGEPEHRLQRRQLRHRLGGHRCSGGNDDVYGARFSPDGA